MLNVEFVSLQVVKLLLQHGAQPDRVNQQGQSALDMARHGSHCATVGVLEQALSLSAPATPRSSLKHSPANSAGSLSHSPVQSSSSESPMQEDFSFASTDTEAESVPCADVGTQDGDGDNDISESLCHSLVEQPACSTAPGQHTPNSSNGMSDAEDTFSNHSPAKDALLQGTHTLSSAELASTHAIASLLQHSPTEQLKSSEQPHSPACYSLSMVSTPFTSKSVSPAATPTMPTAEAVVSPKTPSTSAATLIAVSVNLKTADAGLCRNQSDVAAAMTTTAASVSTCATPTGHPDQEGRGEMCTNLRHEMVAKTAADDACLNSAKQQTAAPALSDLDQTPVRPPPVLRYKHRESFRLSSLQPLMCGEFYRPASSEPHSSSRKEQVR